MARTVLGTLQDILIALQGGSPGGGGGGTVGGSLEATQQQILTKVNQIYGAVDQLELKSDTVNLNADTIRLQTDQVEALISQTNLEVNVLIGQLSQIEAWLRPADRAKTFLHPIDTGLILALERVPERKIARLINPSTFATLYLTYDGRQPNPAISDYDEFVSPGDRFSLDGYNGEIFVSADLSDPSANFIATQFTG